jgi:hypothetical protein
MLLGTSSSCFLKAKWRIFAAQKRADLMKKNKNPRRRSLEQATRKKRGGRTN